MQQKKSSLIKLFYITLLLTASRPPDRSLLLPRSRLHLAHQFTDSIGPLSVENYFYDDIHSIHLNGHSHHQFFSTKSSILLRETLDALEDINSLGRYSLPHTRSNLIAYPVSRGFLDFVPDHQTQTTTSGLTDILDELALDISYSPTHVWENLNNDPVIQAEDDDLLYRPSQLPLDDENGSRKLDEDNHHEEENEIFETNNQIKSEFEDCMIKQEDNNLQDNQIDNVDDILENNVNDVENFGSILDYVDHGDVNDLFGGLELLLSNETDCYNQEWQPLYQTVASNETGQEYPIYDSTQNCNVIYESNGTISNGSSASQYSSVGNNNFGAVLYSSLTTLSNGTDHLNQDLSTNLAYNTDSSYMSNVSFNNSSVDCFYNGPYMDEFNMANTFNDMNQAQHYEQYHQIATSTQVNNNPNNNNKFPTTNTEDCFDKSSDSAVSSMSSDRVQSLSDNDLIETSSESSSYNCEADKCNTNGAQKKYRLFGKNKNTECKNLHVSDYYSDYSQVNYPYSNTVQCSIDSNVDGYNQMNYYAASTVQHNHTYAQISDNEPLNSISSNTSTQDWVPQDIIKDENGSSNSNDGMVQKEKSSDKIRDDQERQERDHFNRDEKKARALKIPISVPDIINLPIDEFNERLTKHELTEVQLSLIRDIRRRGKNKVAAQNCRKRKLDQIMGLQSEVGSMYSQKNALESQYSQLLMLREMARDKYTKLYQFVVEASSSRQPFFELSSSPPDFPIKDSQEIQMNDNSSNGFMVTGNMTSPVSITSFGLPNELGNQPK